MFLNKNLENNNNIIKTSDFTVIERVSLPEGTEFIQTRNIISPKRDRSHVIRVDIDCFRGDDRTVIQSKSVGERINGERIMRVNVLDLDQLNENMAKKLVKPRMDTWLANNLNMDMIRKQEQIQNMGQSGVNFLDESVNPNTPTNFVMREDYARAKKETRIYPNYHNVKRMSQKERQRFLAENTDMDRIGEVFTKYNYTLESALDSFRTALEVIGFNEDDQIFVYNLQ